MNTAVQAMIDEVKQFEADTDKVILSIVRLNEQDVIDLNQDEQLYNGIDATGQQITPGYAPSTVAYKRRKSDPYDRVTLLDRGDFYDGWIIEYRDDEFFITSQDRKIGFLVQKYGADIFGLTPQNIDVLIGLIAQKFSDAFKRQILT
jgi:hypothetical protein